MKITKTIGGTQYQYTRYLRKKKSGKRREINSPCHALKEKQHHLKAILEQEIDTVLPSYVVGFRKSCNLRQNCQQHLGKKWVVNLDIKDFFPSVTQEMLESELMVYKPLLEGHGYLFNDFIEFVVLYRKLPQGSPTSPLLSNYIGYKLVDKKIYPKLSKILGKDFGYTRYADDITISFDNFNKRDQVKEVVMKIINMIESDGLFKINKKKVQIMHRSQKQLVTGVVVNNKTSLGKKEKLRYRAIVHKVKNNEIKMDNVLAGKLAYIKSIDPDYYEKLQRSLKWKSQP